MADADFQMVPQLSKGKHLVMELPLCRVMLEDTSEFVWLVLVPMKNNKKEIHELSKEERMTLMEEMNKAALAVQAVATTLNGKPPTKINTGALGNICPQLHIHVLTRYEGDKAWPGPVWGACPAVPWEPETKDKVIALITAELQK
mmetsp:Transcript_110/g.205  ORF Transcript_110/g.205 Transcript_110/m.205 type:complete len:145 (-) Transcript_110:460-894(-)|eukprot:CAMPEP_0114254204 /NCGR_PEP_ID=MMETSP0058-20121206/16847_1 /TAXON_ID=36894 /ORGANISM="Pyramimonas parkeae, CCMP726" /LENGTH=144 /DNA_ID=CAMNT_0001368393 /DNA_START=59 /DNA_END=493 /DNA_ORIENTATION=-